MRRSPPLRTLAAIVVVMLLQAVPASPLSALPPDTAGCGIPVGGNAPRVRYELERKLRGLQDIERKEHRARPARRAKVLHRLSAVYAEMNLYREQVMTLKEYWRVAAQADPHFVPVWAEMAWPLMKLGMTRDARKYITKSLHSEGWRSRAQGLNVLGVLEALNGNRRAAYRAFEHLRIELESHKGKAGGWWDAYCTALSNLGETALALGKPALARRLFHRASLRTGPHCFCNPWRYLAMLNLSEGDFQAAAESAEKMKRWSEEQGASMKAKSKAAVRLCESLVQLETGAVNDAEESLSIFSSRPDRCSGFSCDPEQAEAASLLAWKVAAAAKRAALAEEMSWVGCREWLCCLAESIELNWTCLSAGWRIIVLSVNRNRLEKSLRPYHAGGIPVPEWYRPELVGLCGPGVIRKALENIRKGPRFDPALEEPYLAVIEGEAAFLLGSSEEALTCFEKALGTLPAFEALLRARAHARLAQLSTDRSTSLGHLREALRTAPALLRVLGIALPVNVQAEEGESPREAARMIARSQRFCPSPDGFILHLYAKRSLLTPSRRKATGKARGSILAIDVRDTQRVFLAPMLYAELKTPDGKVIARATVRTDIRSGKSAAALVAALHEQVFTGTTRRPGTALEGMRE